MPKRTKKLSSEKIAALEDPELAVGEQLQNYLAIVSIVSKVYASATVLSRIENHGITNGILINDGHVKTVLGFKRIQRHEQKMDLKSPHIQMGVDVLKGVLAETKNITDSRNISIGVLLIPSKGRVLYDYLAASDYDLPVRYLSLVNNEDALKRRIAVFLNESEIRFVDVLKDMQRALSKNGPIYPASYDGHPIEAGYRVYAQSALRLYQQITQ